MHKLNGTFVVVVEEAHSLLPTWRRCYFTLDAAQWTAQRARARGQRVTVYLAALTPLSKVRQGPEVG